MADIIDVQSFTSQLQQELMSNITPELKKITDISKDLNNAIIEGNIDVAVETIGSDKVKNLNIELNASNAYFEKTIETANYIADQFAGIEDHTIAINKVQGLTQQTNQRIAKAQEKIKKQEEEIIPTIQSKVHQAELQLSLMKMTDAGYEAQQNAVKDLQDELVQANASTADMIGQELGLLHLRDNQLKILEQQLGTGRAVTAVIEDHVANGQKIISNSKEQLKLNVDIQKTLEGMNDAQKEFLKDNENLINETMGGFDSIKDSILGAFDKLPLVGGLLKSQIQGPLEEATKTAKTKFVQSFIDAKEAAHGTGSAVKGLGAGVKSLGSGIAGIGSSLVSSLLNPFNLLLMVVGGFILLVGLAFRELTKLEDAGRDFRKELGMSADQISHIREQVLDLQTEFAHLGLRVGNFYDAVAAFADVNASVDHATTQQIKFVAILEKTLGVQATTTTSAMANLMKLGATGREEAQGMVLQIQALAQKHGVAFAKVMEDVSGASEDAFLFARGSAKALAEGAVHARRMGSSLDDVASSASALLDFESSINSEMQASSMFGMHINMNGLRAAAIAGDTNAMLEERLRIMDSLGGIENMNRFRQIALAEAMGTSVDELLNMNKAREQERMLQQAALRGDKLAQAALDRRNRALQETKKLTLDNLLQMEEQNQTAEKFEALQNKVRGELLKISLAFKPVVEKVLGALVDFSKQFYKTTSEGEAVLSDAGESLVESLKFIGKLLGNIFESPLSSLMLLLAGLVTLKMSMAALQGILMGKFMGTGTGVIGKGGGGFFDGLVNSFNKINMASILKGAAGIVILSASMFIAAKAFQQFADVGWSDVAKGVIGMVGLGAVAMMLGKGSTEMIKGAAAVAILGAALIPMAFGLSLISDKVGAGTIIAMAGALAILGGTSLLLGKFAPFAYAGAGALIALSLAFVPLGYGLSLVTPFVVAFGDAFSTMVSAIAEGASLIIGAISSAITKMIDDIVKLGAIDPLQLLAVAGAIGAVGLAMASFGVASGVGAAASGIGNAVGSIGNAIAGIFGADEPQQPMDQLFTFLDKLSGIEVNAEALELLSKLNLSTFTGSITDDFGEKMEIATIGIGNMISMFQNLESTTISNVDKMSYSVGRLIGGLGTNLPKIKSTDARLLERLSDGLENFFEAISELKTSKLEELPKAGEAIASLITGVSGISNLPANVAEKLEDLGIGIHEFFYELSGFKTEPLTQLETIQKTLPPFISAFANVPIANIPTNVDSLLNDLGYGIHEFFDELADFDESALVKLPIISDSLVPFLDAFSKIQILENTDKLKIIASDVVNTINSFSTIQNPAVEALSAITSELYMLCEVIDKLDTDKLNGLQNINFGGVQTEIKIPSRQIPPTDPFMDSDVIEGQMKPKLMIADTPDLTESLVVESKSIELNKRQKEREVTFRRQYETVEQLTSRIEHDIKALADEKERAIATNNLKNFEYGEKLMLEDIAVLKKIRAEFMTEQSAVEAIKPSTEEFENTPLASIFTSPPPTEPTIETQNTDLANFFNAPIDVKVINADEIAKSPTNEQVTSSLAKTFSKPIEISENLANEMKPTFTDADYKKFVETLQIKESDINLGTIENLQDLMQSRQSDIDNPDFDIHTLGSIRMSVNQVGMYEKLINEMEMKVAEKFKALGETKMNLPTSNVFDWTKDASGNVDFGPTGVLPTVKPGTPTFDPFALVDETASINTSSATQSKVLNDAIQNTGTTSTSIFTRIAEFTSNLIPDISFLLTKTETELDETLPESTDMGQFDSIYVRGETVFVEELAKLRTNAETTANNSTEDENTKKVVSKLDELIRLMQNGGISVRMDGKKVSKVIATAQDQ